MYNTPEEKAIELTELFSRYTTAEAYRDSIVYGIRHCEEIISLQVSKDIVDYYTEVKNILKEMR